MTDTEVRVLEARFDAKFDVLRNDVDRVLKMVDVNGGSALSRIGHMEKNWEARLVAEAEARIRAREDRVAVAVEVARPEVSRVQVALATGGGGAIVAIGELIRIFFLS